jgi:hypothetical protein
MFIQLNKKIYGSLLIGTCVIISQIKVDDPLKL